MKKYTVCLMIICKLGKTDISTKFDIAQMLGIKLKQLECERMKEGIFRVYSLCPKSKPIDDHVKSILSIMKNDEPIGKSGFIKEISLDVAVMYDTYTCSMTLSNKTMTMLVSRFPNITLSVACYPVSEWT